MAIETSVRYSALVDAKLRTDLVLKDDVIFNNRYEGDVKAGAVKVRKSGTATVLDYDKENGVVFTTGDSEWITININKDKAIHEKIDGFDAAAIPDGIIAERLDEAGRALAEKLDTDGAKELVDGGTALADTSALTTKNVYSVVVDARTAMSKAGVPNDNRRYLVVSPETYALLLKSDDFIKTTTDVIIATGVVGQIAGFNVYESTNLGEGVDFVAGHPLYATRVKEWSVEPHVQDLNGSGKFIGDSAVQGRMVYAHKVTNPAAILVKKTA